MKKRYYIDTCIWLNLFKKEVNPKSGIQYWKFAKDFIEEIEEKQDKIIISMMNTTSPTTRPALSF